MLKKIFVLFKVVVILNLLICLIKEEWAATFICLINFIFLFIVDLIQRKFGFNYFFMLLIYLFLTGSLLGGEVYNLYYRIWYFDIILHTLSSFIISGLLLYLFKYFRINLNKTLFIVFIFSFAMMIAALWEITEFSIDRLFGSDMQKDIIITEINSTLLSDDGALVKKKIDNMKFGDIIVYGYVDIGLYDTIEDMVCALFGSLLFIIIGKVKEAF